MISRQKTICKKEARHYMKVRDLLADGTAKLNNAGIDNAAFDARQLLMKAYGKTSAELLADMNRELCQGAAGGSEPEGIDFCPGDCSARIDFEEYLAKRASHIPLQHIIGSTSFMGIDFAVNESVLIPRQDTETLAEAVLSQEKDKHISVLDMCTGSGCIAVSLKLLGGYECMTAADISEAALSVAAGNAGYNKADVNFVQSDMFDNVHGSFDVIVSNPPYIPSKDIAELEPEVREHDPLAALDGGADGLDFYRRIADGCGTALKDGGRLYLEIGFDQAEALKDLLSSHGFDDIKVYQDLAGLDRVVTAQKNISAPRI